MGGDAYHSGRVPSRVPLGVPSLRGGRCFLPSNPERFPMVYSIWFLRAQRKNQVIPTRCWGWLFAACLLAAILPSSAAAQGLPEMGWLGVSIAEVGEEAAERLGSVFGPAAGIGVQVAEVLKDGPAEAAKLARGDVIIRVDEQPIWDVRQLQRLIRSLPIHHRVSLTVLRDASRITVPVVIGPMPLSARAQLAGERFGFLVREMDAGGRQPPAQGRLTIVFVDPDSPASRAGLKPQDTILRVNDLAVRSLEEFAQAVGRSDRTVVLVVERRDAPSPITATLTLPG
jgi:S1-C subfamily serine protease